MGQLTDGTDTEVSMFEHLRSGRKDLKEGEN